MTGNRTSPINRSFIPMMRKTTFAALASVLLVSSAQNSYALFGQKRARAEAEEKARQALRAKEQTEEELFALGIVLIVVIVVAVAKVKNINATHQTIQQVVVVRTPAHEVVADSVIIDATNVIRSSQDGPPCLLRLIGLLLELEKQRYKYRCFFDASTWHMFEKSGQLDAAKEYRALLREYRDLFIEVPGGTRADDYILDHAHNHGTPIISNDRYRDYASKYPWTQFSDNRRVPFVVHSSTVRLILLGMEAKVPSTLESAIAEYHGIKASPPMQH